MRLQTLLTHICKSSDITKESASIIAKDILPAQGDMSNSTFLSKILPIVRSQNDSDLTILERFQRLSSLGRHGVTKEKMLLKFGNSDGLVRWNAYCKIQAETNMFDYKNQKFGMDKQDFLEYNKSRSVTLSNLIARHGEQLGLAKYEAYCDRQSYTNKLDYFIEVYGEEIGIITWKSINKRKSLNLKNFQAKYGEAAGFVKYEKWIANLAKRPFYSKSSQKLFWKIYDSLDADLKSSCYFAELNSEYGRYGNDRYYFFDFVINSIKFCIEFNGIHYHAKPTIYTSSDIITKVKGPSGKSAQNIWDFDRRKNLVLESSGFTILTIWEDEIPSITEINRIINEHSKNFKFSNPAVREKTD